MYSQIVYSVVAVFAVFIVYDVPGVLSDHCADYDTCVNKAAERFYDSHCNLSVEYQKCETTYNFETCKGAYFENIRKKIKEDKQLCKMEDVPAVLSDHCADYDTCVNKAAERFYDNHCKLSVEWQKCEATHNVETCQSAYYDEVIYTVRQKIKEQQQLCIMEDLCADFEKCVNEAYHYFPDRHCDLSVSLQKCETAYNFETCQGAHYDNIRKKIKEDKQQCIMADVPGVLRDYCADYVTCVNEAGARSYDNHCKLSVRWQKCETHYAETCQSSSYDTMHDSGRQKIKEQQELCILEDVPAVLSDHCADYETCVKEADTLYDGHCELSNAWKKCDKTHNIRTCEGEFYDTVRKRLKEEEELCIIQDVPGVLSDHCADYETCVKEADTLYDGHCELSNAWKKCDKTHNIRTCEGEFYDTVRKRLKEEEELCIIQDVPGVLSDHCADYETCVKEADTLYDGHCELSNAWKKCDKTHNIRTCEGEFYDTVRKRLKEEEELCIIQDVPAVLSDHCADYETCVKEADTLYDGHCELSNAWKKCDKTHNIRTCEGEFYDTVRKRLKEEEELCIIQDVPAVLSDHCADYETCVKEADTLYDGHCELSNAWKKCDKTHDIRTCEGEFYDTVRKRLKEEEQLCIIQEISEIERRSMT